MSELEFLTVLGLGFLLGARHALDADQLDGGVHGYLHRHSRTSDRRPGDWLRLSLKPFAVGMVHGLAGSAALMLMVLSTVRTVGEGVAYILVFGLGSIVGMMLLGVAISVPLVLSASCGRRAQEAVQALASLGSIGLGAAMMVRIGLAVV